MKEHIQPALDVVSGWLGNSPLPVPPPIPPPAPTGKTPFPFPHGHYISTPSPDDFCHSGQYWLSDRPGIATLQRMLSANGYSCAVDGICGVRTLAQIRAFQRAKKLVVDGKAGEATWAALGL